MEGFATMLRDAYGDRLDGRALRWLGLIEENGRKLAERVQSIFELARVGASLSCVQAVNPSVTLQEVIKQLNGNLESKHIRVHVQSDLPHGRVPFCPSTASIRKSHLQCGEVSRPSGP